MSKLKNKELIMKLHDIWNTNGISEIPNVYSDDVIVHWSKSGECPKSIGYVGIEKAIKDTLIAFPDWHENILEVIAADNKIVTRYVSSGTHMGKYFGISPTGNKINVDEISIFRIENDKVVEQWCLMDDLALLKQLES